MLYEELLEFSRGRPQVGRAGLPVRHERFASCPASSSTSCPGRALRHRSARGVGQRPCPSRSGWGEGGNGLRAENAACSHKWRRGGRPAACPGLRARGGGGVTSRFVSGVRRTEPSWRHRAAPLAAPLPPRWPRRGRPSGRVGGPLPGRAAGTGGHRCFPPPFKMAAAGPARLSRARRAASSPPSGRGRGAPSCITGGRRRSPST